MDWITLMNEQVCFTFKIADFSAIVIWAIHAFFNASSLRVINVTSSNRSIFKTGKAFIWFSSSTISAGFMAYDAWITVTVVPFYAFINACSHIIISCFKLQELIIHCSGRRSCMAWCAFISCCLASQASCVTSRNCCIRNKIVPGQIVNVISYNKIKTMQNCEIYKVEKLVMLIWIVLCFFVKFCTCKAEIVCCIVKIAW